MWGRNSEGQCSHTSSNLFQPQKMQINTRVAYIDLGDLHSCFLNESKTMYTCGDNTFGQCGQGTENKMCSLNQVTEINQ